MARPINFSLSMLLIEVQLKTQMPRIMKSTYPWHSCLFVSRLLLDLCGFAAFRAERLCLSESGFISLRLRLVCRAEA